MRTRTTRASVFCCTASPQPAATPSATRLRVFTSTALSLSAAFVGHKAISIFSLPCEGRFLRRKRRPCSARCWRWSPDAPSKGLEVSAVLEAYCRAFIHPAPYELHYSPMHRARCLRDLPAYCAEMHGADPDLAAHFTVARAVGLTLWGPPAESMFGPVPRAAYLDSIRQDVGTACSDIRRTPASTTLNLCRTLAFAQEGLVLSKEQGGHLGRVPSAAPTCRLRTKRGRKLPFRRAFSARARTGTGIRSLSSAVHLPPGLLRAKHLSTSRDTTVEKSGFPQAVPPVENALFISCFTVQPPRSARCATPSAASRSALRT